MGSGNICCDLLEKKRHKPFDIKVSRKDGAGQALEFVIWSTSGVSRLRAIREASNKFPEEGITGKDHLATVVQREIGYTGKSLPICRFPYHAWVVLAIWGVAVLAGVVQGHCVGNLDDDVVMASNGLWSQWMFFGMSGLPSVWSTVIIIAIGLGLGTLLSSVRLASEEAGRACLHATMSDTGEENASVRGDRQRAADRPPSLFPHFAGNG